MPAHGLLQELVLVYALAVGLLVLGGRLRVPPIVALIVAGIVAGPAGLAIVKTEEDVELLAEIGIALLLFTAGLDFSVAGLLRAWRGVVMGGTAQMILTAALVAGVLVPLTPPSVQRIAVLGVFVALSSTAIVIKELTRRNQIHAPHGQLAIGVLLLQDLVVIVLLVLAPMLLGKAVGGGALAAAFGRVMLVLAAIALAAWFVLPLLLRVVSRTSREAFSLAVLLASVGTAWLSSLVGLSMAVGAFLAGLVLAGSEVSYQVHAEVRPIRDVLASLFFISVGMLVDPIALAGELPLLVGVALAIVAIKAAGAGAAFLATGTPLRVAAAGAVVLSQVGEFSLLLGGTAYNAGVIAPSEWQLLLGASVVTMMATPGLVSIAPAVGARLGLRWAAGRAPVDAPAHRLTNHVVILGYGVGGRLLARALRDIGTPYIALDLNGSTVREAIAAGESVIYADATSHEPLHAAGAADAAAVVGVLSDPDATERAVRAVRMLSKTVPVIVRTRYRLEADRLRRAGATVAVAEELEASFDVLAQLLARLEVPGNMAEVLLDTYRRTTYGEPVRAARAAPLPFEALPPDLGAAPVATWRLSPGQWAAGRTLADIDLRAQTGATILAIRRDATTLTSPAADTRLAAGDVLYLMGDEAHVRVARARLESGPLNEPLEHNA